jgi:molybdopterin molybdotransferase
MTGAAMPDGCDTVLPNELAHAAGDTLHVPPGAVKPGAHRRLRGEDIAAGTVALARGRRLGPADAGLLASLGLTQASVARRPRVALFSTGDELREPGAARTAGAVYDSNRYTLHAMLRALGCEVLDLGIAGDDPAALETLLLRARAHADLVLTSGGMAAGAADHTREVMARLGRIDAWRLAMKPGRPLAFGRMGADGPWLFGLPGNPVAVMVAFAFFVRPALLRMMGGTGEGPPMLRAVAREAIAKKPGRMEFQRVVVDRDGGVRLTGAQGSGMLSSMVLANALLVLDEARGDVAAGDGVAVIPFEGLF